MGQARKGWNKVKLEAWWFENTQKQEEILQPSEVMVKTHFGIYAEMEEITYPFTINVTAAQQEKEFYHEEFVIENGEESNERYEIDCGGGIITFQGIPKDIVGLPDQITVEIKMQEKVFTETVFCEYARLHGKITDFDGNPFPAPVFLARVGFAGSGSMGTWSNKEGEYSVVVPKGCYNTFYVDDNTYGVKTLENWSWHMIVDQDEEFNFKVGNAEVYSLCVWSNNGGSSTLFFWFRSMMLPSIRQKEYEIELHGSKRKVNDISPELELEDITVTINGIPRKVISLQKIYETGNSYTMPSYILQTDRPAGFEAMGKQTAVVEYNTAKRSEELGYTAQSQGRCQFFFKDACALSLL